MTQSSRWALGGGRLRFPDISPRAYEHPADRGALVALRAIPGFDAVLKAVSASYANAFRTSSDPLFRVVGTVGTVVGGVGNAAAGRVRDWWQQGRDGDEHDGRS
jgi:hypothetical protein